MSPCPKHPKVTCLTNFQTSSNFGRTSSVRESRRDFGSSPPCQCGLNFMSQQRLEDDHYKVNSHLFKTRKKGTVFLASNSLARIALEISFFFKLLTPNEVFYHMKNKVTKLLSFANGKNF